MLLCVSVPAYWQQPAADRSRWEDLLDAFDALTPLVDDVRPGLAFLDMNGIAGTPPQWMRRARELAAALQIDARVGAAGNKIAARAAAYKGDATVSFPGHERALLKPLPLSLLDIDAGVIERLRLLGIERLGDLARLPHGPFVRRFGAQAAQWHELANGIDRTPFVPRGHAVAIEAALFGEGRAEEEAQVFFALRMLLARIAADLDRCGKRAGALALELELDDAQTQRFDVPLALPTAQERAMFDVVRAKLDGVTFSAAVVGLRVRAGALEEGGEALALISNDDFDPQTVAVTIARLEAALGAPVQRAVTRDAHVLEERFTYQEFGTLRSVPAVSALVLDDDSLVPQLRLLAVTEIPVQMRRGEPAFVGDPPQAVLECTGPWRIELQGFPNEPVVRDEYDLVLADGRRCRIYRQGQQWYLRGIYD